MAEPAPELSNEEKQFISEARSFLEDPSFLIRAASLIGRPLDRGMKMLPERIQTSIHSAVRLSVERGLALVTKSIRVQEVAPSWNFFAATKSSRRQGFFHTAASFGTGAVGGFFGVISLPVELPITTAIMLRSIVATAQEFGMDVSDPEVQLECLYVLSLGSDGSGGSPSVGTGVGIGTTDQAPGDSINSAYWTSRLAFTDLIRYAAREIERSSAPFLVRFLASIAARFELVVSEKAIAELLPVIGALGGGGINAAFSDHFNRAARYHFGLRALERRYGEDVVRAAYLA